MALFVLKTDLHPDKLKVKKLKRNKALKNSNLQLSKAMEMVRSCFKNVIRQGRSEGGPGVPVNPPL